jgi:hypothetical protein
VIKHRNGKTRKTVLTKDSPLRLETRAIMAAASIQSDLPSFHLRHNNAFCSADNPHRFFLLTYFTF